MNPLGRDVVGGVEAIERRYARVVQSLDQFYADDSRKASEEVHFGSQWRSHASQLFEFSVFWIVDTEELCALRSPVRDVASDGPVSRFVLGIPPHTNLRPLRDEEATVEVLASLTKNEVDERLSGWESRHADPDGFDWLRRAVAGPGAR